MIGQTIRQTPIFNDLKGLAGIEVCVSRCKSVSVCKVCALNYAVKQSIKSPVWRQLVPNRLTQNVKHFH